MRNCTRTQPEITIGVDLGDKHSHFFTLSREGDCLGEGRIRTSPADFRRWFSSQEPSRVAIEVGTHSPWASRVIQECGHEVLVANSRQLPLISKNPKKRDPVDAQNLARLARVDPELLKPIQHRGVAAQCGLALLRARERFKKSRTVGAYLGLTQRKDQSGKSDPQLRITKCGDQFVRKLLVCGAHYILGPFGPDTDLRRHGEAIIKGSGGKNPKKRAVVAVARKLAAAEAKVGAEQVNAEA